MNKLLLLLLGAIAVPVLAALAGNHFIDTLDKPATQRVQLNKSQITAVVRAGDRLMAAGRHGMILSSRDLGATWKQASVPVESDLVALAFPTSTNGWAVGHDGVVLTSTDSGASWTKRFDGRSVATMIEQYYTGRAAAQPANKALTEALAQARQLVLDGPDKPFLDVWFKDAQHGFLIGAFNLILATDDGGATWTPWLDRIDNPQGFHLTSIRGSTDGVFIVGEQGLLLKLDIEANRFIAMTSPYAGSYFGIISHNSTLIAFGLQGRAFRSEDGARSWQALVTDTVAALTGGTFLSDGRLVLVGDNGSVLVSADRGDHFSHQQCGMSCYAVAPGKTGSIIVAGSSGVHALALQ